MSEQISPIYLYDGSFDGLLCCLFTMFERKEIPSAVASSYDGFLPISNIASDDAKAGRVRKGILRTMGERALYRGETAYLSERDGVERSILLYWKLGFDIKKLPDAMLYDEHVKATVDASDYTSRERHRYLQFLRFSDSGGVLTSVISPKANILPLLLGHFRARFPHERFLIYDDVRGMALAYDCGKHAVFPIDEYVQPDPDEQEKKFRELFRIFYDTIEIKARHNERCRMSHMPKRFWKNMTEFGED